MAESPNSVDVPFPATESTTHFDDSHLPSTHPAQPPPPAAAVAAATSATPERQGTRESSSSSFALPSPSSPNVAIPHAHQKVPGHIGSVIVHFNVGSAKFGPEKVKPLTYFALETSVKAAPFSPTRPTSTQETQPWTVLDEPTTTDRRYSEFVEIRTFLCYAFPWMVVPPLPGKSHLDDLKTFWADPDSLIQQHRSIDRFMKEIMGYPTLLQFQPFQQFCQLPRDSLPFGNFMDNVRHKNAELDSLRGLHTTGVGEATKMVKNLFSSVSGWLSSSTASADSTAHSASHGGHRHIPPNFDDLVKAALVQSEPYQHWDTQLKQLEKLRESLQPLIAAASEAVNQAQGIYIDITEAGTAMHDYAGICGQTPRFTTFGAEVGRTSSLLKSVAAQHNGEYGREQGGLINALMHELFWVDAAAESARGMQYVIKTKLEQDILNGTRGSSQQQGAPSVVPPPSAVLDERTRVEQCYSLNGVLQNEFSRFWNLHRSRMHHLAAAKARRAIHYLEEEAKLFHRASLITDMNTPSWALTADVANPTVGSGDGGSDGAWVDAGNRDTSERALEEREDALAYFHRLQRTRREHSS